MKNKTTEYKSMGDAVWAYAKLTKCAQRIRRRRLEGKLTFLELYNACQRFLGEDATPLMKAILEDDGPLQSPCDTLEPFWELWEE